MDTSAPPQTEPAALPRRIDPRWAALVTVFLLVWALPSAARWAALAAPSFSPLLALAAAVGARDLAVSFWIAVPALALAWWTPRGICRYVCPLGPVLDAGGRLRRQAGPGRIPAAAGRVMLAVILGAAALGWPFLLWLDPFVMVNAFARMTRHPAGGAAIAAGLAALIPLAVSVWRPRAWCGRLCPLGALQDGLSRLRKPARRDRGRDTAQGGWVPLTRRDVLGAGAGVALAAAARASGARPDVPVRPPGAVGGDRFGALCVRCGNCAGVCPARIIHSDPGRHGVVSFLSPVLRFDRDYCREDCLRCASVCPSGALAPLAGPDAKRAWKLGLARVDASTCILAAGEECTACVVACPYGAIRVSSEGFDVLPEVDPALCNGCGACEAICPVRPGRAIRVVAVRGGA